jgi:Tfp pilus assembly protein PilF
MQENFGTLRTRAAILEKKGDTKAANELRARAMSLATENDLNQYGYALLGQKKVDEAIAIFKNNVQAHPNSWNVHDSLAEAYMAKGDKKAAAESYGKALTLVKDQANKTRIEHTLQQLKGK